MALLPQNPRNQKLLLISLLSLGLAAVYQQLVWTPKNQALVVLAAHLDTLDSLNRIAKIEVARGTTGEDEAGSRRLSPASSTCCAASCRRRTKCRRCSSRSPRPRAAPGSSSPTCSPTASSTAIVRYLSLQDRRHGPWHRWPNSSRTSARCRASCRRSTSSLTTTSRIGETQAEEERAVPRCQVRHPDLRRSHLGTKRRWRSAKAGAP